MSIAPAPAYMQTASQSLSEPVAARTVARRRLLCKTRFAQVINEPSSHPVTGLKPSRPRRDKQVAPSVAAVARGKKHSDNLAPWRLAVASARDCLHVAGSCAIGGATEQGQQLHAKAREIYVKSQGPGKGRWNKKRRHQAHRKQHKKSKLSRRALVMRSPNLRTAGGLAADRLRRSSKGVIASMRKSEQGKIAATRNLTQWTAAVLQAKRGLRWSGFQKIVAGGALHKKARMYYDAPITSTSK